jgi:D-glycero-alpha-D-manno-heptose-7-phosphate kinase
MIISRTPFRVSLFGGGTDYPQWYRRHGGSVLGFTINKYCYITLRVLPPFFEHKHRIVYSRVELVRGLEEIQHPAVRAVLQEKAVRHGVELHHDGDLPARSGLGSSSAFTVGLLNTLAALEGRMLSRQELAAEAIRIEQEVIRENVGSQDQVWAAYGGLNRIDFNTDGTMSVLPVVVPPARRRALEESLMLFFTGFSRFASEVAKKQIDNFGAREAHLKNLGQTVEEGLSILQDDRRSLDELGRLLHEGWRIKRELADGVSTPAIDEIYSAGRAAGALGGKLLGAGGGGFMLFYVPPEKRAAVREQLRDLIHVGFKIEGEGSKIVLYEPNGL